MEKWKFVGMCRCPINNAKHAICTKAECPLHGDPPEHVAPLQDKFVNGGVRAVTRIQLITLSDPWEI